MTTTEQPLATDQVTSLATERKAVTAWTLAWRKFRQHRMALIAAILLILLHVVCLLPDFFAPYLADEVVEGTYRFLPPQKIHFLDDEGNFHFPPFVYGLTEELDFERMTRVYIEDKSQMYHIEFFVQHQRATAGPGSLQTSIRLFGIEEGGVLALLGTDTRGRDLFSRILYGGQISLTISILGVLISVTLGTIIGVLSGYYGGLLDMIIQRVIEILSSIPRIPLWLALAALVPLDWPSHYVYGGIVTILAFLGWTGMARSIRAMVLSSRERVYIRAARAGGANDRYIMVKHIFPSILSYFIVSFTLQLPGMILAESSLSFLGLGIQPPMTSWGLLMNDAQRVDIILQTPWLILPGLFIILTTMSYNFLGDGMRDAADPFH